MIAILSLEKSVVCWPIDVEKQSIKDSIEESHGFPDVIGIMDGTHIVHMPPNQITKESSILTEKAIIPFLA